MAFVCTKIGSKSQNTTSSKHRNVVTVNSCCLQFTDGIVVRSFFSVNNSHRFIAYRRAGTKESPVNTKMTFNNIT